MSTELRLCTLSVINATHWVSSATVCAGDGQPEFGMVTDLLQADNEVPTSSADPCGSYSMLPAGQKGHLLSVDKDPERLQSTPPPPCLKCH